MSLNVGVDIGGTFTDITVLGADRGVTLWKEASTPSEPELAVQAGLRTVAAELGYDLADFLARVSLFVHGSTIATNTLIERNGPIVGLVCTRGFRDTLYFRDGFKWDRFNPRLPRPPDFVDRRLRLGVEERVCSDGSVARPLEEGSVRAAAEILRDVGVGAVAVSLLWAHVNPLHERKVRDILAEELAGIPVLLSSDVLPEVGEWVRTSSTVLSAYIYPRTAGYLRRLDQWLRQEGFLGNLLVMQVNGGCARVEQALKTPVSIVHCGPAAVPAAARQSGARIPGPELITIDMGGTSLDVCLMRQRATPISRQIMVNEQPIGVPGVEIHSIGAGGGSIAWIDSGNALRVGPSSAGSSPGPAAYGRGGTAPTVTDANVVLGYLSPMAFLGGRTKLFPDLAWSAVENGIANGLGVDTLTAAAGIIEVVNNNMVNAIRAVSLERGIDPRPYTLLAGGGAAGLHIGRLLAQLKMKRAFVPTEASTLSAFGMTATDITHDYSAPLFGVSREVDVTLVTALFKDLEDSAVEDLRAAGMEGERVALSRYVDARYAGQVHELLTPVPEGPVTASALEDLRREFNEIHTERYGYGMSARDVELLSWRVTARGLLDKRNEDRFSVAVATRCDAVAETTRSAYFAECGGFVDVPVYLSSAFSPGGTVVGPGLIESSTTTVVVYPGQTAVSDGRGNLLLEL